MKKLLLIISTATIFLNANAQVPANDEPCGAINIPVLAADPIDSSCVPTILYSYTNATGSIGILNPSCYSGSPANIRDVWYKCTVPTSGKLKIGIANPAANPYTSTLYTGSCSGTLTELTCNNINAFGAIELNITAIAPNTVIYLRIFISTSSISSGGLKICITDYYSNLPIINNTTKVGIGTTSPLAKLDVAGSSIFRDSTIFAKQLDLRNGFKMTNGAGANAVLTADANGNASWQLPINYWSTNASAIYNNNSGNIGIGTTTPVNAKLVLNGSAAGGNTAIFGGETSGISLQSNYPGIGFNEYEGFDSRYMSNGYGALQYLDEANGTMKFVMMPNGIKDAVPVNRITALSINNIGNIGIGIETPTSKLDVNGDINLSGKINLNGNTGSRGQVLTSNGGNNPPSWANPINLSTTSSSASNGYGQVISISPNAPGGETVLPLLTTTVNTSAANTRLLISYNINYYASCTPNSCFSDGHEVILYVDNVKRNAKPLNIVLWAGNIAELRSVELANFPVDVIAGNHTIEIRAFTNQSTFSLYQQSLTVIQSPF